MTERIESINQQLIDLFGIDTINGLPIWRVVWSHDQLEKRLCSHSPAGIELITPQVFEVPKYRQWVNPAKWILERLVLVPESAQSDLPVSKLSYEPIWVFQDDKEQPLPPRIDVAKFVIDTIYATQGKSSLARYKDPEADEHNGLEFRKQAIEKLEEEMFGDESGLNGAIVYGHGVGYTGPSKIN